MEETKKCPYCGKEILAVAKKCKHCKQWLVDRNEKEVAPSLQSCDERESVTRNESLGFGGKAVDENKVNNSQDEKEQNQQTKSHDNESDNNSEDSSGKVMIRCTSCGEKVDINQELCPSCGKKLVGKSDPIIVKPKVSNYSVSTYSYNESDGDSSKGLLIGLVAVAAIIAFFIYSNYSSEKKDEPIEADIELQHLNNNRDKDDDLLINSTAVQDEVDDLQVNSTAEEEEVKGSSQE